MGDKYEIHFDFNKHDNIVEFFQKTTHFLQSLDELNEAIVAPLGYSIETNIGIEELQSGSLKAIIADKLKQIDDNKMKQWVKDPKTVVSDFLIFSKHKLLKLLEKDSDVATEAPLLLEEAIKEKGLSACGYSINKPKLLASLSNVSKKSKEFSMVPTISIENERIALREEYVFRPEELEGVTKQTNRIKGSFIIKKPDLVGTSKWTIIFDRAIEVKIQDEDWLKKIENHEVLFGSGDKIKGTLITESFIDERYSVIETKYYLDNISGIETPNLTNKIGTMFQ